MINIRKATQESAITIGNGECEEATAIADIPGTICDQHGREHGHGTLRDVILLENGKYNLFSLTKMMLEGWTLGGDKEAIWLSKGDQTITFDIKIPTPKGVIYAMYMKRDDEVAGAGVTNDAPLTMSIAQAHDKLGHCSEDATRRGAKALGWHLTKGSLKPCAACAAAKAKQKNVPKYTENEPSKTSNGRIYLDIATLKDYSDGPTGTMPNWRIMVDERTQLKFSDFYATKNGMIEPTCVQFKKWQQAGMPVKNVRMDNAGENIALQTMTEAKEWQFGINFEYTARDTPQQNSLAEVGFASLASKGRALLHRANVPLDMRYKLWKAAFKTATLLDGLASITLDGKTATRYEHWSGTNPDFAQHLRIWGEAGTVKTCSKQTPKVVDRGVHCMMIGYAIDHTGDCYLMWNPITNGVHTTRDVIWLKRMFFEQPLAPVTLVVNPHLDVDVLVGQAREGVVRQDEPNNDLSNKQSAEEEIETETTDKAEAEDPVARSGYGRALRAPARLIDEMGAAQIPVELGAAQIQQQNDLVDSYEIGLSAAEQHYYAAMREFPPGEVMCVGAGLGGGFGTTQKLHVMKYNEALEKEPEKWYDAVQEEHERMEEHKVFQPTLKTDLPKGAKVLTSTWAMKKKANGTYRARVNARGYEQVDGVHYDEDTKSAPVVNGATIHIVLIMMLMSVLWIAEVLDVQGAFLYGEFLEGEVLYMKVPQGFEQYYPANCVLLLLKTIYGLKQAAYAFWRRLVQAFQGMGYARNKADPCLYFKWTIHGLVLWVSWVDDCLVCGTRKAVDIAKSQMKGNFSCDEIGELKEYVGCKINHNKEERAMKITQPVMIQSFEDEFDLPGGAAPNTPAVAGSILVKGEAEDNMPLPEQTTYRSGVGKLLHMMWWSRPEMLNSLRELSRMMSGATAGHMNAMLRAMKYCVATPNRGIELRPNEVWDGSPDFEFTITGRSDSDYAKDLDTRRSVSGYSSFLCGAPVTMKSQTQRCVTLSVTEAELVGATSCAQDMIFGMRVVESMGLKVKKPMILKVDNKGSKD